MAAQTAPFGTWRSPITAEAIVSDAIRLGGVAPDGGDLYWLEGRPAEGGRYVLVRRTPEGRVADVTPAPYNVRTRVHEYGGGAFLVAAGTIYFVHFDDQRLYWQRPEGTPQPLTDPADRCYADFVLDRGRQRLVSVCEDRSDPEREPTNTLASIDLRTGAVAPLVAGSDFYSAPRLSPDGAWLAWVSWNHPHMPWDGTRLWVAPVAADGALGEARCVAGGEAESVCHPQWSPAGELYFVSDRSNWWNLYRQRPDGTVACICEREAEFGVPHWVFGQSTYAFLSAQEAICTYTQQGYWYLATLDLASGALSPIETRYTDIGSLHATAEGAAFVGSSPTEFASVVSWHRGSGTQTVLRQASSLAVEAGYLSVPEAIAFPTDGGQTAYAWFYPPQNRDYRGPEGERPPLLVKSHGGPTAASSAALDLRIQYWTSRGFAFVDVNYSGSTGYGRDYRRRLHGNWGVVDVRDCAEAARYLARQGRVDGDRLAIRGSSAGGYTTLAALTFESAFRAGASYYGVSDPEALAQETHKFESRYLDSLIAPYPQRRDIYQARSPIAHAQQLACPVIFFQGLEDRIVPPNQAERMVEALRAKGIPVAYVPFEGEQHGFRRADNIKRALEAELYFYGRIFGFEPADAIAPVAIANLGTGASNA